MGFPHLGSATPKRGRYEFKINIGTRKNKAACNWTFRQYKLCRHHQQNMQGTTLLMITAELMLSKRPILKFTAALFFS